MGRRGELVDLGGLWREGHGLSEKSEALGLSSPVRRAAPSLQMQTDEPVEASCGLAKAAALTILQDRQPPLLVAGVARVEDRHEERRVERRPRHALDVQQRLYGQTQRHR